MFDLSDSDLSQSYERHIGGGHVAALRAVAAMVATRAIQREHVIRKEADRRVRAALNTARKAARRAAPAPTPAAPRTIGERVLAAASAARGLTVAELASAAGVTRAQAQSACQRLLRAGKLNRSGKAGAFRYSAR